MPWIAALLVLVAGALLIGQPSDLVAEEASAAATGCPIPGSDPPIVVPPGSWWQGWSGAYYVCRPDGKWELIGMDKPVCSGGNWGKVIYDPGGKPQEFCNRDGNWEPIEAGGRSRGQGQPDINPETSVAVPVQLPVVAPAPVPAPGIGDRCRATYTVTVERDPIRPMTLKMEYGDGTSEIRAIPEGSGIIEFELSHDFTGREGVFFQSATLMETGAYDTAVTAHPANWPE